MTAFCFQGAGRDGVRSGCFLRLRKCTESKLATSSRSMIADPHEQQIPPLRCAPVGMTDKLCRDVRLTRLRLRPEFGECAGGSGERVGGGKADVAHAFEDFRGGSGAADVPVFVLGVGADDEEVVGGSDAAVAGAGRENDDIARVDGDMLAAFSAEDESRQPPRRSGLFAMTPTVRPPKRPSVVTMFGAHFGCSSTPGSSRIPLTSGCTS